ncbi:hypothetical protein C8T65DRAFT_739464 [Cerioporus squamosus]|nr:hypothetical protein C8T65DRAFT_739464 [Cerioporus squamosus]
MPAERRKYIPSPLSQSVVGRRYRRNAFGQFEDDGCDTGPKPSPFLTNEFSSGTWSNPVYKPPRSLVSLRVPDEARPCPLSDMTWLRPGDLVQFASIAKDQREIDIQLYGQAKVYVPCGKDGCPYCSDSSIKEAVPDTVEELVLDVRVFPGYKPGRVAEMPKSFRSAQDKKAKGAASRRIRFWPYFFNKEQAAALNSYPKKNTAIPRPYDRVVGRRKRYWDSVRARTEGVALTPGVNKNGVQRSRSSSPIPKLRRDAGVPIQVRRIATHGF